jgi:acetyltransferase
VATHTGALAGSYDAFVALCRKYELIEMRGFAECVDTAELFLRSPQPKTKGIAALSLSGGGKGYLLDLADELSLSFPEPSAVVSEQLRKVLGMGSRIGNPLDLGAGGAESPDAQVRCVELMASEPAVGLIAFQAELPQGPDSGARATVLQNMIDRAGELGKSIVFYSRAGYPMLSQATNPAVQFDVPFLQDIRRSFQAISHFTRYCEIESNENNHVSAKGIVESQSSVPAVPTFMPEQDAFTLLEKSGVKVARFALSVGKEAALQAAEQIGYPVALKASIPGLTHKNQSGGVRLNLQRAEDLSVAFDSIQSATTKRPSSHPQVLVQEMVRGALELYVGGRWDREFGPLVLFGFGGIFVEDIARVCTRLAPVEDLEADDMINESGVGRALCRLGHTPSAGHGPIIEAIVRMSHLIATHSEVDTIEVNPLLFRDAGLPCVAVDVVSVKRS